MQRVKISFLESLKAFKVEFDELFTCFYKFIFFFFTHRIKSVPIFKLKVSLAG